MKVNREERTLTLRQSSLNTWMLCPERARLDMVHPERDSTTDAAAVGTAVHAGIETVLRVHDHALARRNVIASLEENASQIRWVQVKQLKTAFALAERLFEAWLHHVLPQLAGPLAVEETFNLPWAEINGWQVRLSGTIDYVDENLVVWDWKTSSRPYETWEADRWKIQPTVYGWAMNQLHGIDPVQFTYCVLVKKARPEVQIFDVERSNGHWAWLHRQVESIVAQIDALPDGIWPLNDHHALCSAKWCPHWEYCKGLYV